MQEIKRIFGKKILSVFSALIIINICFFVYQQVGSEGYSAFRQEITQLQEAVKAYNDGEDYEACFTDDTQKKLFKNRIRYVQNYDSYVSGIIDAADVMESRSIFSKSGTFASANIKQTGKDYMRLSDIELSVEDNSAIEMFLSYNVINYTIMLVVFIAIYGIYSERDNGMWTQVYAAKSGRLYITLVRIIGVTAGSFVMCVIGYLCVFAASAYICQSTGNMLTPVQNMQEYGDYTYAVNKLEYIVTVCMCQWFVIEVFSLVALFLFGLFRNRINCLLTIGIIIGAETLLYVNSSGVTLFKTLQKINLLRIFDVNKLMREYENISFLGTVISQIKLIAIDIFILFAAMLPLIILIGVYMRPVGKTWFIGRIIEYLSPFRQKILASEPVFLMEFHKILFTGKGCITIVIICIIALYFSINDKTDYTDMQTEHDAIYLKYGGADYSAITDMLHSANEDFEEAAIYLEQINEEFGEGRADALDLEIAKNNYDYYAGVLQSYEEFQEKADHIEMLSADDTDAYMISDRGYECLLGKKGNLRENILATVLIFGTVIVVTSGLSVDARSNMAKIISTGADGRGRYMFRRAGAAILVSVVTAAIVYTCDFIVFKSYYGVPYLDAPVCSLTYMVKYGDTFTVGQAIMLFYTARITLIALISAVLCVLRRGISVFLLLHSFFSSKINKCA